MMNINKEEWIAAAAADPEYMLLPQRDDTAGMLRLKRQRFMEGKLAESEYAEGLRNEKDAAAFLKEWFNDEKCI